MDIRQINFPKDTNGTCEVVEGSSGRIFRTTPRAVAIAMLGAQTPEDAANGATGDIIWTDYLSTHGIAVGHRGKRSYVLAFAPSKERTVNYTGAVERAGDSRSVTALFPPLIIGVAKEGNAFRKGVIFGLNTGNMNSLGVTVTANVAFSFPYGNVYQGEGRICWGSVQPNHIQTAKDLEELFFGSDFNGDLYYGGGGRLNAQARAFKGKPLPVPAANTSMPGIIRQLSL